MASVSERPEDTRPWLRRSKAIVSTQRDNDTDDFANISPTYDVTLRTFCR